jgi:protein-S-isoprenylcysteine O-methyltransferase Ste14
VISTVASGCAALVAWIALARVAFVILGLLRQAIRTRRTLTTRWGWVETLEAPEPFLLGVATFLLYFGSSEPSAVNVRPPLAVLGAILAVSGALITAWAMATIPSLSAGHYVLPGQEVVASGPYARLRHPMYFAVFLIWLGLAAAFSSLSTFLVAIFYVIPGYWMYARSEERMMLEQFGEPYRRYQAKTGMLFPKLKESRA